MTAKAKSKKSKSSSAKVSKSLLQESHRTGDIPEARRFLRTYVAKVCNDIHEQSVECGKGYFSRGDDGYAITRDGLNNLHGNLTEQISYDSIPNAIHPSADDFIGRLTLTRDFFQKARIRTEAMIAAYKAKDQDPPVPVFWLHKHQANTIEAINATLRLPEVRYHRNPYLKVWHEIAGEKKTYTTVVVAVSSTISGSIVWIVNNWDKMRSIFG